MDSAGHGIETHGIETHGIETMCAKRLWGQQPSRAESIG